MKTIYSHFYAEYAPAQSNGCRPRQEDHYVAESFIDAKGQQHLLIGIADGMGGYGDGDKAGSLVAVSFQENYKSREKKDLKKALEDTLIAANEKLLDAKNRREIDGKAGSTYIGFDLTDTGISWLSAGDSMLFRWRDRELTLLNELHEDARGRLTSGLLGTVPIPRIDCKIYDSVKPGDRFIIASDGIETLYKSHTLEDILKSNSPDKSTAEQVVKKIMKAIEDENNPHQDNTTLIVLDIKEHVVPQPAGKSGAWLIGTKGELKGQAFPITAGENAIGRATSNKICTGTQDTCVSREKHAVIEYSEVYQDYTLIPKKGRLVRLGDLKISEPCTLRNADTITLGQNNTTEFIFFMN